MFELQPMLLPTSLASLRIDIVTPALMTLSPHLLFHMLTNVTSAFLFSHFGRPKYWRVKLLDCDIRKQVKQNIVTAVKVLVRQSILKFLKLFHQSPICIEGNLRELF